MMSLKLDGGLITKARVKKDLDIVSQIGLLTVTGHDADEVSDSWEHLECGTPCCRLREDLCDRDIHLVMSRKKVIGIFRKTGEVTECIISAILCFSLTDGLTVSFWKMEYSDGFQMEVEEIPHSLNWVKKAWWLRKASTSRCEIEKSLRARAAGQCALQI